MAVIFFQHLKDVILLSSGFCHFCWEVVRQSYCSITSKTFYFWFSAVWLWCICVFLFVLSTWGLLNFLNLGWSLSFVWTFLSHLSPSSSLLSEIMYFEIPGDCSFALRSALCDHIKSTVVSLSSVTAVGLDHTNPEFLSNSSICTKGKKKRQLLIANSLWNSPLSRVLVHHVVSTTIRRAKKWFFVIYLAFSNGQQEVWPAIPYYILHESRICLVVSECLSDATCPSRL